MDAGRRPAARPARRAAVRVPPARMPLLRAGRPLKRWRYVGVFSPELMLAVADVHIGPLAHRFLAVARRAEPIVVTTPLRGISLSGSRVRVRSRVAQIDLLLEEDAGVETIHRAGRAYVWTRKQAGVRALGSVTLGARTYPIDARAVIDDTAGYHPRHTSWSWSAGIGRSAAGQQVAWNLVSGINDAPSGSERAVWLDGTPAEVGPVSFARDLSAIAFDDGASLRFSEWCAHEARTNLLLVRSTYNQPFGTFDGALPGGIQLAEGLGVMESHDAWW